MKYQIFKVSPRGFLNEIIYYRVPLDKIEEANAEFETLEDTSSGWVTREKDYRNDYQALDWCDRNF